MKILLAAAACFAGAGILGGTSPAVAQEPSAPGSEAAAPGAPERYGATPEELVPYREYGDPYRLLFGEPLAYKGTERKKTPPEGLTEVRIGLLVPPEGSPEARAGRGMREGAEMAVAEANAAGGYEGLPFRLMVHPDLPIWGASSNEIVAMAWDEKVWAILGSVSGDSSHIAIRVALKAGVAVMNTATTDPTFTETGIPWAFRCIADDRQQGYALALHVFRTRGLRRLVALRSNDRYGRLGITEFRDAARRLGHPLVAELKWLPGTTDFAPLIERIRALEPDGVVLWGQAEVAGRALKQMREMGVTVPAFGSAGLVDRRLAEAAGAAAEGLVAAATFDPTSPDPLWQGFRQRFRERYGEEPDAMAAHAYDGMQLLLSAIAEAGLNRARIRDALAAVGEYHGVTGRVVFDNTFNDVGPAPLAVFRDGEFRYGEVGGLVVGLLRPPDGEGPGEAVERGVRLALAESAVAARLVVRSTRGPWTTVGETARDLIRDEGACGLVSALDGKGSHVAAQLATRLRRPLAVATEAPPLLAHTGVGWISTAPGGGGDEQRAGYLAARRLLSILATPKGGSPACSSSWTPGRRPETSPGS